MGRDSMQGRTQREIKLNIIIGVSNQILILLINLVSKNVILNSLNLDYLGLQTVFGNFCDLFSFAFSGIGFAVLFSLYRPFEDHDQQRIRIIYRYYDRLYRIISFIVLGVGLISTVIVLFSVNADISNTEIILTYLTYLISIIAYNRYLMQHYFVIANQKRYIICLINGLVDTAALAVEIAVLRLTRNYELFLLCLLFKNIVINGIVLLYLRKIHPYLFEKEEVPEPKDKKSILGNIKDLILYRIGTVMLNSTDSIIVSLLISTAMSGCYANYLFISNGVLSLVESFYASIVAKIGRLITTHSKQDQFQDFWNVSMVGLWINGFTVTCFFFLVQDFILLWMGSETQLTSVIVGLIALNLYLAGMRQTTGTYRQSAGIFHKVGEIVVLRGILNLVLSFLLGWFWGLFGILIATTISNLATLYWYEPYLMFRYFGKSFRYEFLYQGLGLLSTAFCLLFTGLAISFLSGSGWLFFLLKAFICFIISNGCYLAMFLLYQRIRNNFIN